MLRYYIKMGEYWKNPDNKHSATHVTANPNVPVTDDEQPGYDPRHDIRYNDLKIKVYRSYVDDAGDEILMVKNPGGRLFVVDEEQRQLMRDTSGSTGGGRRSYKKRRRARRTSRTHRRKSYRKSRSHRKRR